MKNILAILCLCVVLALGACKGKSGANAANPGGGSVGGGSETLAKSNLDTMIDSAKMPAHVKPDSISDTTKKK